MPISLVANPLGGSASDVAAVVWRERSESSPVVLDELGEIGQVDGRWRSGA